MIHYSGCGFPDTCLLVTVCSVDGVLDMLCRAEQRGGVNDMWCRCATGTNIVDEGGSCDK